MKKNVTLGNLAKGITELTGAVSDLSHAVGARFDKVDGRFDKIDGRLDRVDGRLDKLEFEVHEVKKDVKWMKDNVGELFKKLDDIIAMYRKQEQELAILNMQYKRLEERVAKLEGQKK